MSGRTTKKWRRHIRSMVEHYRPIGGGLQALVKHYGNIGCPPSTKGHPTARWWRRQFAGVV